MITININDVHFRVPTSYFDITFGQYVGFQAAPPGNRAELAYKLTGIPPHWYNDLMLNEREAIDELLAFADNVEILYGNITKAELFGKTEQLPKCDFENEPFEKYIKTMAIFSKSGKSALFMAEAIVNVYFNLSILNDSLPSIYKEAARVVKEYEDMLKKYPVFEAKNKSNRASLAGVDRFKPFGEYATLAMLSGFDPIKMNEVKLLPTCEALQLKSLLSLRDAYRADYESITTN
jgi:hypothetical protein